MCKIVERIKKSRMHATTMDNVRHKGKISATPGSSPAFPMPCLPMPMPMLMPLFFRRIVLPLSPSCRATLTSVHRQQAASSLSFPLPFLCLPALLFLFLVPLSPNAIIVIDFAQFPMRSALEDAAPLALCSLLRGCCLLDAAAVATVAGCHLV